MDPDLDHNLAVLKKIYFNYGLLKVRSSIVFLKVVISFLDFFTFTTYVILFFVGSGSKSETGYGMHSGSAKAKKVPVPAGPILITQHW
jgi:hypothetical protein